VSNADSATCLGGITFNQGYTYDTIGNLTNKAGVAYTYPANGGVRPHAVSTVGGAAYTYDNNGNLLTGGGRTYTWNAENQPTQIVKDYITESYAYNGDNVRIKKTTVDNSTRTPIVSTTRYVGGLVEYTGNKTISSYGGIAVRTVVGTYSVSNQGELVFLHSDHLGSVSATSNAAGTVAEAQNFDPWGALRSGGITSTEFNYTGQRKDAGTGLLFYNARYYDPVLGRFTQADSIVPGTSHRALTVDYHEGGFRNAAAAENNQGFWFQLSDRERKDAKAPWGTDAPQELNRYSYVNNNPLRYTDPSGHESFILDHNEEDALGDTELERYLDDLDIFIDDFLIDAGVASAILCAAPGTFCLGGIVSAIMVAKINKEQRIYRQMLRDAKKFLDKNGGGAIKVTYLPDGTLLAIPSPIRADWSPVGAGESVQGSSRCA